MLGTERVPRPQPVHPIACLDLLSKHCHGRLLDEFKLYSDIALDELVAEVDHLGKGIHALRVKCKLSTVRILDSLTADEILARSLELSKLSELWALPDV